MSGSTAAARGWRIAALTLAAVLAATGVTACASGGTTPEPADGAKFTVKAGLDPQPLPELTTIKVSASSKIDNFSSVFLADYLGEFKKENLKLDFVTLPAPDALPALGQGQLDIIVGGVTATMANAISEGADVKFVAPTFYFNPGQNGIWVADDIDPDNPAALKGQEFATSQGAGGATILAISDFLEKGGLDITDVKLPTFPIDQLAQAMTQGVAKAAWVTAPTDAVLREAGGSKFVSGIQPGDPSAGVLFGPNVLTKNPAVGAAFLRALARTIDEHLQGDYKKDPQTVKDLAAALGLTEDEVTATPSVQFDPKFTFHADRLTDMQAAWKKLGVLSYDELLPPDKIADLTMIDTIVGN